MRGPAGGNYWLGIVRTTFTGHFTAGDPLVIRKDDPSGRANPTPEESEGVLFRHVGEPKGQIADWRATIDGEACGFHAVEYADRFECHIDEIDPTKDPLGHLVSDSPGTLVAIGAVAAAAGLAALAYALSRRNDEGN